VAALIFTDPVYDGAADPVLVRNHREGTWWMLYTSRRASAPSREVSWVHGSDVGVASSADGGATWTYRGTLDLEREFGRNTFWAPEVIWREGRYHMFVSYIRGVPDALGGRERHILHYSSIDLQAWDFHQQLQLSSDFVIDAAVFQRRDGSLRLWYKDEADGMSTWAVDTEDLVMWSTPRHVLSTPGGHEGPNVFEFRQAYWLIVDTWAGQSAFRSSDLETWQAAGTILDPASAAPSACAEDTGAGYHADVVVDGERAFVVYFTHPEPDETRRTSAATRRSSILVAELGTQGDRLVCDRSHPVRFALSDSARS
jgi:sucrose-6-phosphate hydrolase SacC (GH32 family)